MNNTQLYMTHNLQTIPRYPLPDNYQFHLLNDPGEMDQWANIVTAADEFGTESKALDRFRQEFQPHLSEAKKRMIFVTAPDGDYAGTATAWFDEADNHRTIGRLHWVAVHPEHQGRKLGKPLIAQAMNVLARYHAKAYLRTQPRNLTAIQIYLSFGFQPLIRTEEDKQAWQEVYRQLQK